MPVWSAVALLLLTIVAASHSNAFAQETEAETHLFLVDVSDSMWAKPEGPERTELELRRDKLKGWLLSHPNSRVTLMSFDTDVHSPIACDLRNASDRQKADDWVEQLAIKRPRGTYLWSCVRKALTAASELARKEPGKPITLHVLTDRVNTQRKSHREELMREFPTAKWPPDIAERKGDFDITIPPLALPTPPPISPTPGPTITASVPPTATASPRPTPTPSPTPPPGRDGPSPASPQAPSPSPCVSPFPCSGNPAFESAQNLTVSHGQFVQFVNKTSPPARLYQWTAIRNDPGSNGFALPPSDAVHWGHEFTNSTSEAQSYTIRLTADYGSGKPIEAAPVTLLVQPQPGIAVAISTLWNLGGYLGTALSGLVALASATLALWKIWRAYKEAQALNKKLLALVGYWLKHLPWTAIAISVFFVFLAFCIYGFRSAAAPSSISLPVSVNVAPANVAPGGPVIVRESSSASSFPAFLLGSLIAALLTAAFFLRIFKAASWREPSFSFVGKTSPSIKAQLDELKEFSDSGVIQRQQARKLRNELFEKWRVQSGLTKSDKKEPGLPDRPSELIGSLIVATKNKSQEWKRVDIKRTEDPASSAKQLFRTEISFKTAKATDAGGPIVYIELSTDGEFVTLGVFHGSDNVIASIDENAPDTSPEVAEQLVNLHNLVRESVLGVTKTLDTILADLKTKQGLK